MPSESSLICVATAPVWNAGPIHCWVSTVWPCWRLRAVLSITTTGSVTFWALAGAPQNAAPSTPAAAPAQQVLRCFFMLFLGGTAAPAKPMVTWPCRRVGCVGRSSGNGYGEGSLYGTVGQQSPCRSAAHHVAPHARRRHLCSAGRLRPSTAHQPAPSTAGQKAPGAIRRLLSGLGQKPLAATAYTHCAPAARALRQQGNATSWAGAASIWKGLLCACAMPGSRPLARKMWAREGGIAFA